jgi:CBS domain-containing protein
METTITTVQPTTSVDTVIALLLDAPFRALPVVDTQNHLQGIISTGDLINADVLPMRRGLLRKALEIDEQSAVAQGDPAELSRRHALTAQDVMNRQVRAVAADTSMHTVAQIMIATGLRRLPVTSAEGQLLGMITRADMLQVIVTSPVMHPEASTTTQTLREQASNTETSPQQRPIRDYASSAVTTINEQASLNEIVEALVQSPFKRVVVIDDQLHVRGIISDIDLLAQVQAEQRPGLLTWLASWAKGTPERVPTGILRPHAGKAHVAADVMNRDVITVSEQSSVQQTIEQMITTHRKILPVVDVDKRLVGIVGRSDVLRILLENQEAE